MAAASFSYRGMTSRAVPSSGSEASSSEDESGTWKRKRVRQSGVEEMEGNETFQNPNLSSDHSGRPSFKRNNVWGDVVCEQTVNQDLSSFGVGAEADVAHTVSRDVESYKVSKDMLELANKEIEEVIDGNMDEDGDANAAEDSDKDDIFERKIFDRKCVKDRLGCSSSSRKYRDMDNIDGDDDGNSRSRGGLRKRERKQDKNEDFSSLLQQYQKEREEIKVGEKRKRERAKRFATKKEDEKQVEKMEETPTVTKVTAEDEPEVVLKHVMKGLEEDNKNLFGKILDAIGNKKMLDIYVKTLDVEDVGGMMTFDGRRRRTPGGVFIQLLKSDKDIRKEQLDSIFAESHEQWKRKKLTARKMKRKKQAEENHREVKKSMLAPGMEDVYRKLLDDQLASLQGESQQEKSKQEKNPADAVNMEADVKEESEERMESVEASVPAVVTPPPSPEEGSEEGEILD